MMMSYYDPGDLVFIQSRADVNQAAIDEYAQLMAEGVEFDPVQAVQEGQKIYVWDGFHRGQAAIQSGKLLLVEAIPDGTKLEAQWLAYGANQKHGLRRNNADKRRVVELALLHPAGQKSSNREIARHCGVSHFMVNMIWDELIASGRIFQIDTRQVSRGDQVYEQNTTNIGLRQAQPTGAADLPPGAEQPAEVILQPDESLSEWLDPGIEEQQGGSSTPITDEVMNLDEDRKEIAFQDDEIYGDMGQEQIDAGLAEEEEQETRSGEHEVRNEKRGESASLSPPPPPPAIKSPTPPDWNLHLTIKYTGICLMTLNQAGQSAPVINRSVPITDVPAQVVQALVAHVPGFTAIKELI